MSLDRCKCDRIVDTDIDTECYDNPEKTCLCNPCREEQHETEEGKAMTTEELKHTEGTLSPHSQSKTSLVVGKRLVAACGGYQSNLQDEDDQGENEANARRIAAAWNACVGIPTGDLETLESLADEPRNNNAVYWKTRYLLLKNRQEKDATTALSAFAAKIALMTQDGEEIDGKEFVMENDDAVSTMNDLISEARDLANGAQVVPGWQSEAERLAGQGYIINVAATPHGFCASILSERNPFEIFRCQLAPSLRLAFEECRKQMGSFKPTGEESKAGAS